MAGLEDRVRVLEKQVRRYRILNLALAIVVLGWFGFVMWNLMHLQQVITPVEPILRTKRLEIVDGPSSRPVCVLRAEGSGGRIEVFDHDGNAIAGFDGNRGLVVRSTDAAQFPK